MKVDDLVRQRLRTSDSTWNSEMMCRQPLRDDSEQQSIGWDALAGHLAASLQLRA